jgi:hypothetical protein
VFAAALHVDEHHEHFVVQIILEMCLIEA